MRYIPYQTPMNGTVYQSVPTIGSIGGYGNPYQNNYYNQYMNPYYLRQQQELQKKMEMEQRKNQAKIWARMSQCAGNMFGYKTPSHEELLQYMNECYAQQQQMISDQQFMNNVHDIAMKCAQNLYQSEQYHLQIQESEPEEPSHKSLQEFLTEDAQERYMESQYAIIRKQQRNTSNLYDQEAYRKALGMHDSVFNCLNNNVNIDDMEIQVNLPQRLKEERAMRRQAFINKLNERDGEF